MTHRIAITVVDKTLYTALVPIHGAMLLADRWTDASDEKWTFFEAIPDVNLGSVVPVFAGDDVDAIRDAIPDPAAMLINLYEEIR